MSYSATFTILHTNDRHGHYLPIAVAPGNATAQTGDPGRSPQQFERAGRVGGFPILATAVEQLRRERGAENVLLLDGGDGFADDLLGNLTRGEAVVRLMNEVGYQAMALGNHDFDYGAERIRELQHMAHFPMRGANVVEKASGQPFLGDPTLLLEAGGTRVGILALGYYHTDLTTNPSNVQALRFENGIEAARRYLPNLRQRVDVVVVLSHQGTQADRLLAKEVPGIDLIVGAHSHDEIALLKADGVWMSQAMSDGVALGELVVTVEGGRIRGVRGAIHFLWTDSYQPDLLMTETIYRMREPFRNALEPVVAIAAERIGRRYRSESPFDVLAAELLRRHTGAAVGMLPGVGYGVSLDPGPFGREQLHALLPHPSQVVMLEMSGAQILSVLEQSATNQRPPDPMESVGGLVQTAGMRWTVDLTRPVGKRIRNSFVGETPIDPATRYRVATHSGMLAGVHRYAAFAAGSDVRREESTVAEVVEAGLRQMGTVRPPEAGRITLIS